MKNKETEFMQLYKPLHAQLYRYVQSFVWDKEEAKDLVSEVVLRALEGFHGLRDKDKFLPFLFGIARNIYFKQFRVKKLGIANSLPEDEKASSQFSIEPSEAKQYELRRLLLKLPELERELICLFELSGFSYSEIAQLMDLSEGQVKAKLYHARQQLKTFIKQDQTKYQLHLKVGEKIHGN